MDSKPQVDGRRVPWNGWLGLGYVVTVFIVSQIIASGVLGIYLSLRHIAGGTKLLDTSIAAQFFFVVIAEATAIGLIFVFVRGYSANLSSIGLRRPKGSDMLYALAAVPVYYLLYLLVVAAVKQLVPGLDINQSQDVGFTNVHGQLQLAMTFVSLVVLPPLAEEIMVRGFLYSSLKKVLPGFGAVIFTSALFAAAHLPEGGGSGPLYIAALDTFTLSLVLIYLREKTGGLWASITLHVIKNGIAFAALFALHIK